MLVFSLFSHLPINVTSLLLSPHNQKSAFASSTKKGKPPIRRGQNVLLLHMSLSYPDAGLAPDAAVCMSTGTCRTCDSLTSSF